MKDRGPFEFKSSKEIYTNPWISVREDSVIRPGGEDGIFGVVDAGDGAKVVALTPEKNILLAREFKYGLGVYTLECLGGGIDDGENPEDTAKRELKEEAGAESDDWQYLGYSVSLPSFVDFKEHLFLAQDVRVVTEPKTDAGEIIEIVEMPFSEALRQIAAGDIIQDSSTVAIFKAHALLNQ